MGFLPIHPAVVHLPIAFVLLSVASDVFARVVKTETHRAPFRILGFGALVAAVIGTAAAIAAGYWDIHRDALAQETDRFVSLHITIGWIFGGVLLLLAAWRWLIWYRGQMTINTAYLVAGFLVLGLTFFQGWFGGEMVYSYGAGVAAAGQGTQTAEAAQGRLAAVGNALQSSGASQVGGAESPGGINQARASSADTNKPPKLH